MGEVSEARLGNIRGAALDEFFAWYAETHDRKKLARVVEQLPPQLTSHVRWTQGMPRLVPFTWYPCELIHAVIDGLIVELNDWERERFCRETADAVMERTLKGVYKAMFKAVVSPNMMARFSPRLWKLYYDSGENTIDQEGPTRHRSILRGWKGHHPFLCEVNRFCGEWIYGSLGCQHVRSKQLECVARGDSQCVSVVNWT